MLDIWQRLFQHLIRWSCEFLLSDCLNGSLNWQNFLCWSICALLGSICALLTWSWWMIFILCSWIWFVNSLMSIFLFSSYLDNLFIGVLLLSMFENQCVISAFIMFLFSNVGDPVLGTQMFRIETSEVMCIFGVDVSLLYAAEERILFGHSFCVSMFFYSGIESVDSDNW